MDILNDEKLEALGLMKEIDTLKVIRAANESKLRQKRKRLKWLLSIMMIFCILAQAILFKWIGFNPKLMMLSGLYLLCVSLLLLCICYKEGEKI